MTLSLRHWLPAELSPAQRHLALVRFLGYIGAQFSFLLVPLLVFQLSGNAAVAGGLLLMEWLPKVGIYLVGGSLVQRLGERRMHVTLEAVRTAAMVGLVTCTWCHAPLMLLGLAAALYQCSNAVSNIVFERAVTKNWATNDRAQGQTLMLKQDQLGCLLALTVACLWAAPAALTLLALGLQASATLMVVVWAKDLHGFQATTPTSTKPLLRQLWSDFKAMRKPALWSLMGFATLSLVCNAVTLTGLAFFLEEAQAGLDQPTWRAGLLLGKTILAIGVLTLVQRALTKGYSTWSLARIGLAISLVAMLVLSTRPTAFVVWGTILFASGCSSLVTPWLRTTRQRLVEGHIPAESKNGVTGILSAAEPLGYVVGGILLGAGGGQLTNICVVGAACALCAFLLGLHLRRTAALR